MAKLPFKNWRLPQVCPLLGERKQVRASSPLTNNRSMEERARQFRKKETWAEKLLWRWLRDRRFSGYKFRRQHPLGDYYLDFFCEEADLAIELDGSQHGHPARQAHDAEREKFLKSLGIKTLR